MSYQTRELWKISIWEEKGFHRYQLADPQKERSTRIIITFLPKSITVLCYPLKIYFLTAKLNRHFKASSTFGIKRWHLAISDVSFMREKNQHT